MAKHFKYFGFIVCFVCAFFLVGMNVNAQEITIDPNMSQDEIDGKLIGATSQDSIVIAPGDYSTEKNGKNYHKIINVTKDNLSFVISGNYTELQFINRANGTKITANNATIDGNASTEGNASAALFIEEGSMYLSGNLTLVDHNHGVRLGYKNAGTNIYSALTLTEFATLNINDNVLTNSNQHGYYGGGYDDPDSSVYSSYVDKGQGNGTSGSAIDVRGRGNANLTLSSNAKLNINNNIGAGIYAINVTNFTFNLESNSYALFTNNGQGICMNTDYPDSVNINLDHAILDINHNHSNGITGQSLPYILNVSNGSKLNVSDNGAVAINNFYIIVNDSTVTANNNGSHGISNVSFDATNSTIDTSNNAYIGLNISKYNAGKESTDIINSTITANNNGGPGVRFYISNGVTNIKDSSITTNKNGYGDDIYGFGEKPGDSGYWAGIVAKGDLYISNSTMMSDGVSGYSLYDDKNGEAKFHVLEDSVIVSNGEESNDIFDDYNSENHHSGNTIVTGGSLQIDSDNVTASDSLNDRYHSEQNPTMPDGTGSKEEVQFAGPVNSDYTALTQFVLHQDVNKEVGGEGSHVFTYIDPNTGRVYRYQFRYNQLGEDLDPTVFGRAYVWAPTSIVHYDATEGFISNFGTSGRVIFGSSMTEAIVGLNTRFASDVTIFGNSMNLAEKILATASREGYVFLGWYIADDQELAQKYASEGNFEALYELLNTEFNASTKIMVDGTPVEELTVYAKWGKMNTGTTIDPEVNPPKTGVQEAGVSMTYVLLAMSGSLCAYAKRKEIRGE